MLNFTNQQQIDSIINHAKEEYPYECCGIIAGRGSSVERIIKMKNVFMSSEEYSMSDDEIKKTLDSLDEAGLEFIAVYHSHPTGEAYPSAVDIKRSVFPELDQLIISLIDRDGPKLLNFKIIDGEITEEPYMVGDSA